MKNIKYILLATNILALVSCTKFLEKSPQAVVSDELFFADEKNVEKAVNRIYGTISWREYTIGRQSFSTHEMGGEDIVGNTNNGIGTVLNMFQTYTYDASNAYIQQYWDRTYANINFCNQVIDRTPAMKNRDLAEKAESQAKFFRAYYNFDLVNVFGQAPLRDHVPSAAEYDIPKSDEDAFYNLIIKDLEYAIEKLPTRGQWGAAGLGHVTKGTAQGLLAKVYLFRQDYAKAQQYANDVITGGEYSLFADYRALFSPDNLYSSENMMPGGYLFTSTIWSGRWYNPYLQYQGVAGEFGDGVVYPTDALVNSYETNDPREAATIFFKGDKVTGWESKNANTPKDGSVYFPSNTNYANKKVIWPKSYWNNGEFSFQNVNPMFMRYAEILLIYAEASNELGQSGNALTTLEQIRYRARGNKTFADAGVLPEIITTDKADLREKIWHERHIELALEGHRWFDLVRYNKVVPGYTENLLKNVYQRANFNYNKFSRFPIPQNMITSSQGILTQNEPWK
ncbi:Starch-binding associating with outer membrane [Chitinophaga sp. CF118]|uniref:RagB/SusD family nutrient uptake outer membrane protein n=1 Tax=Chitinophaga sp. CF118 TaxID=1884367 RepID=UPI0008EB60FD|nr:RagB/SusD family nutrient uptake outer membrane protein [Chitinophaga sp. CF118]SFD49247.1 Starch-binding associating with outer membrane [Chitinophaga sp. CF118]